MADRGDEVQRAAARRSHRSSASTRILAGRPAAREGQSQLLFGGMGRLTESSILNLHNKSHAVTADIVVPRKRRRGRDHRAGRPHRRLEPLREGRNAEILLQLLRPRAVLRRASSRSCPRAHQVRMEFAYDGGGPAKAATSRSTSTANRSEQGASNRPQPASSPPTRPRHRHRSRLAVTTTTAEVQRHGELGRARCRRRRRRSGSRASREGSLLARDGPAVTLRRRSAQRSIALVQTRTFMHACDQQHAGCSAHAR